MVGAFQTSLNLKQPSRLLLSWFKAAMRSSEGLVQGSGMMECGSKRVVFHTSPLLCDTG